MQVASDVSGQNLRWFFDQWIYRKGWPIYAYVWRTEPIPSGHRVTVTIQQHQTEPVFQMPIQLRARAAGSFEETVTVNNSQRTQQFQFDLAFRPDSLLFDPDGWILKQISSQSVAVGSEPGDLPQKFVLYQNYPNPFNPVTTIRFDTPREGHVTLQVFDLLGQEVAVLVNERRLPGRYEVRLNNETLTSGVYFYRLTVMPLQHVKAPFVETKKMLSIR